MGLKNSLFVLPSSLHDNDPICSMLVQVSVSDRGRIDKHGLYNVCTRRREIEQWLSIGGFKQAKISKITYGVSLVRFIIEILLIAGQNFVSAQVRPKSARRF